MMASTSDESQIFVPVEVEPDKLSLVNWDKSQHISALAFILQYESRLLLPHELESSLVNMYECLKELDMLQPLNNLLVLLENIEKEQHIYLNSQYRISIRDRWLCKLTILSALKFHTLLFTSSCSEEHKKAILHQALGTFRPDRSESIHILQLIAKLSQCPQFELDANLIAFVRIVAYSPISGFKQLAETISKNLIRRTKASQLEEALEIEFLPLKGITTSDLPMLNFSGPQIVTRIIEMFSNNIENREGSFLYRLLLKTSKIGGDFDVWTHTVWPQFYKKLQMVDYDGEFFQSLLKYWIPITVITYKTKLYQFVYNTHIPAFLKGYVLLETRRRSFLKAFEEQDMLLLEELFSNRDNRKLAFQVVGCHIKKGALPSLTETLFVSRYLVEQTDAWSREEALAFNHFLVRISVAVTEMNAEEECHLKRLRMSLISIFKYGISLLKTSRRHLGAQVVLGFYNSFINNKVKLGDDLIHLFKYIQCEKFMEVIEGAVLESSEYCFELMDLAIETIEAPKVIVNDFLMDFINESCNALSIKVSDSVKNISHFIALANAKATRRDYIRILHNRICEDLLASFECKWSIHENPSTIFKVGLLFEALNQISRHIPDDVSSRRFSNRICSVCFPTVTKMMHREYYQPKNLLDAPAQWLSVRNKIEKIVEAVYNNLCEYLLHNTTILSDENKVKLMETLVEVIEHSSMRRPTTLSADLLKALLISIDKQVEGERNLNMNSVNYKVNLLSATLHKLEQVALTQTLTIRRNPETRLVLHALCTSDLSSQKYCLTWTLNRLLQVLSHNVASNDATTAAALHCTEILMSDCTLSSYTLKYAPAVIIKCIRHFENRNWIVRNASMQLAKALVDRFLGVLMGRNNRPKSVDNLFHLFPELMAPFHQIVASERVTDSAMAVMLFFFESQLKSEPFATELAVVAKKVFAGSFTVLVKQNSGVYGLFAARAYVSLCLNRDIPSIVEDVVEFVVGNVEFIRRRHTLRNFVLLLQELYDKYQDYVVEKPVKPSGFYRIHESFAQLTWLLRQLNKEQFDFLLVKVDSLEHVEAALKRTDFILSEFRHRLWLHNYMPFLLINTPLEHLAGALSNILSKNIPDFLQVKLLSIIVDKFTKETIACNEIIVVLSRKALNLESSQQQYLLICYYKVILLLYEAHHTSTVDLAISETSSLLIQLRQLYKPPLNYYKTFISLLLLPHVETKSQNDKTFIKNAVKLYQNSNPLTEDLTEHISETLKYLYVNCECPCDKRRILKLALRLLVEHGQWHFITFIIESDISSPIRAMHEILDFHFLRSFFDGDVTAFEFVKDFYSAVNKAKPPKRQGETYYVEEDGAFVDLDSIGRAVIKFLVEFSRYNQMDEWLAYYAKVRNENKLI